MADMSRRIAKIIGFVVILAMVLSVQPAQPVESAPAFPGCRFGLTIGDGGLKGNLASTYAGGVLDWGMDNNTIPTNVEYLHVLRVGDRYTYNGGDCLNKRDTYADTLAKLPAALAANPGEVWLVGNEPDTNFDCQDSLTAEKYAERFYAIANLIRSADPTARIGFGSIVQPTSIRLRYLDRTWNRLVQLTGNSTRASSLIDIWSIHSFILNEWPSYGWGTGVPPGFENDFADAVKNQNNWALTYDINAFKPRIESFRNWMNGKGERNKPLWITEYGSLLPPIDPPGGPDYVNVTDAQTAAYMTATFDTMLSATSATTGLSSDGNRLVQRWFWVSLSNRRYTYGGTLFDPLSTPAGNITPVGTAWVNYVGTKTFRFDYSIRGVSIIPTIPANISNPWSFKVYAFLQNLGEANDPDGVTVSLYAGDPAAGGVLVDTSTTPVFFGCGGRQMVSFDWTNVTPPANPQTPKTLFVRVDSSNDSNASNNTASYHVYFLPNRLSLPFVTRNY